MRLRSSMAFLWIALLGVASSASAASSGTSDEETLKLLSVEWMNAIERKDRQALEKIVAESFVLQMPGDTESDVTRREEWLVNALRMDWSDFRYENLVAQVHGDHATVSAKLYFRIAPIPIAIDNGVVDTWERNGGRWQVTRRYLGQSDLFQRATFVAGALAAGLVAGIAILIARRARRSRKAS